MIGGEARGRTLLVPSGQEVRPTLNRVREALFNIIAPFVDGSRFLDLFAGSGANGIEALSRGAAFAVFVEENFRTVELIERNLEHTRLATRGKVVRAAAPRGLSEISDEPAFDLVFADPPYAYSAYAELGAALHEHRLIAPEGRFILEHAAGVDTPERLPGLKHTRVAVYGDSALSFYLPDCPQP